MAHKAQRIDLRKPSTQKSIPVKVTNTVKTSGMKEGQDEWRARDDAETIARAAAIKADPTRRQAAAKAAGQMADERSAQVRALRGLARGGR